MPHGVRNYVDCAAAGDRYLVQIGGARLTVKNKAGWTPLMQAVVKGDLIMTR